MVGLIDRLRRNRVFAFVLALTLACAMALPTLGFADEEAAGQVAVQAEAGIAGSTDFDEVVEQEKVVTTEEPVSAGIETSLSPLAEANLATWTGSGALSWTADVNIEDLDRLYGYYDGEPTLTAERDVAFTTSYDGAKTTITLKESWLKTLDNGNYSIDSEELEDGVMPSYAFVIADPDNAKEITSFQFGNYLGIVDRYDVWVTVQHNLDISSVEPVIEHTGVSINPAGPQDFSNYDESDVSTCVQYAVTAKNGSKRTYFVRIIPLQVPEITNLTCERTGLTELTVSFTSDCMGDVFCTSDVISDGGIPEITEWASFVVGENKIKLQFIPKIYDSNDESYLPLPGISDISASIPAALWFYSDTDPYSNGQELYREEITIPAWKDPVFSSEKDITSVKVGDVEGVINGIDITVLLPAGTDVTAVTPAIVHTGKSISPTGPQDFSQGPVEYTVTAEDGSTETYDLSIEAILIYATDVGTYTGSETKTSIVNAPVADFVTLHRITSDAEVELTLGEDYTVSAAPAAVTLSTLAAGDTGSTLITFTESYLSTLAEGTYDYVATYKQGVAPFTMTVDLAAETPVVEQPGGTTTATDPTNPDTTSVPKTGDDATALLPLVGLLALGGTSLVVASRRRRTGRHMR